MQAACMAAAKEKFVEWSRLTGELQSVPALESVDLPGDKEFTEGCLKVRCGSGFLGLFFFGSVGLGLFFWAFFLPFGVFPTRKKQSVRVICIRSIVRTLNIFMGFRELPALRLPVNVSLFWYAGKNRKKNTHTYPVCALSALKMGTVYWLSSRFSLVWNARSPGVHRPPLPPRPTPMYTPSLSSCRACVWARCPPPHLHPCPHPHPFLQVRVAHSSSHTLFPFPVPHPLFYLLPSPPPTLAFGVCVSPPDTCFLFRFPERCDCCVRACCNSSLVPTQPRFSTRNRET